MPESMVRVLLIDDDQTTFVILRELFDERYEFQFCIEWANSFESGLAAIRERRHDVYLVDHHLDGRSGIELLKQAISEGCKSPIILLTGRDNRDVDVAAMQSGAADSLVKDVYNVARLEHAIRYALERRRLLDDLEQERDLLRALLENLPDSIYFKDAESRFLRISRTLASRFGLLDPNDAIGKSDADYFTSEHASQARHDELELMKSDQPVLGIEEKETWPDGRTTWAETSKLPLKDLAGRIVGTFGVSRDITTQKLALQALRDSEFRTRMIVETALDAFVAIDSEGTILDWNAQAAAIFGWKHQEALGKSLSELIIPPQFRAAHKAGLERYLATGNAKILGERLELSALHRDGREFPVEITISALRLKESVLFAAFIHDITKRKLAEAALREAKEAAEAASRAKSDFLANMSHEIRTPMNAVIGMTELLLDTQLQPAQREYVAMVHESGESLLMLINDILDFSKIEAGKFDLIPDVFRLRETLGDTMKSLAVRAHREKLELAFGVDADVPDVLVGDAGRLRQIVVNLVGNAIKFTHQGEVVLEVRRADAKPLRPGVTPTLLLHFSVRDTGIGIPSDKLSVIFDAFEQGDSSTTRKYGGTGLGLAISKRLSELMGGRVWVESQLGVGSTFHFTAQFVVAPTVLGAESFPAVAMNGTRVLIVDDNATNRRILEEMCRSWGLAPVCAESARRALELMREAEIARQQFTIVLSDLHMPDADGFMLAEAIRQEPNLAKTLILMLTSGDRQGDVAKCQQFGVSKYLLKPVKQSELFNALVTVLGVNVPEDHSTMVAGASDLLNLPPLRILLAEDSVPNQKLAIGLLTKWGHHVVVANDGVEAVRLWASPPDGRPFDVVLMDIQMPEKDGFEATAEIRQLESQQNRKTPIVAMTAHAMKGDRESCLEAGMDGYVAKPIRQHELVEVLREVVVNSSSRENSKDRTLPVRLDRGSQNGLLSNENSSPPDSTGRLDWTQALNAVANDRTLLIEVLQAFLEELPVLQARLEDSSAKSDWRDVAKVSHTLQSSLRLFGGEPLEAAQSLELECKRESSEECLDRFAKFRSELENAAAEIVGFLKGQ